MKKILLCTDLDRTLLPNGIQAESPHARTLFKKMVAEPAVRLAYVSGRDFKLVQQAIHDYHLPDPDFMIGDVGTTIYHRPTGHWQEWPEWQDRLRRNWPQTTIPEFINCLAELQELELQEPAKQNRFKLSYYTDAETNFADLQKKVRKCLGNHAARIKLICSVDEVNRVGLLDILPATASKLEAVNFLIEKTGILPERAIYAGDSGNDLEILTSGIKAILVANAITEVRQQATNEAPANSLYLARGDFMAMNGNYAAGILEGIAHYLPELIPVITGQQQYP